MLKELTLDELLKLPNGTKVCLETDDWGKELEKATDWTVKQDNYLVVGNEKYSINKETWEKYNWAVSAYQS